MNGKVALNVKRLRSLRKSRGLSQEALVQGCEQRHLRVSVATIKRAETGKMVSYRTARELAQFFEVEIESLLSAPEPLLDPKNVVPSERTPHTEQSVLTVLWLRLECHEKIERVLNLLQFRGSLWQEQLGSVVLATFGNSGQGGQGHLHGLRIMLEIRDQLLGDPQAPSRFYAMMQLGETQHILGKTALAPKTLQWFADCAGVAPLGGVVVADELRALTASHFHYEQLELPDRRLWLLENSVGAGQVLPLVGRSAELLQLSALIENAECGHLPPIAHITGPAGIGKSRLLSAVQEQAKLRDVLVADINLEAGWSDPVETLTNGLCKQLVTGWRGKQAREQYRAMFLGGECGPDEELIFSTLLGIEPPTLDERNQWRVRVVPEPSKLVSVMARLVADVAERSGRSLMFSIDNLHLASPLARSLLTELLRQCTNVSLTCVITTRSEANLGSPLQELVSSGFNLTTISLGPLARKDMEALCRGYAGLDPDFTRRCIELAEGVPLYLLQLMSNPLSRKDELPTSLQLIVEQKLSLIQPTDVSALELLSVCDAPLPLQFLAELLGERDYLPEPLMLAQLVKIDLNQRVSICHQLVRQVIYHRLGETQRKAYHGTLGAYLASRHESFADAAPATLARHFEAAGELSAAASQYTKAASNLLTQGFYTEAQQGFDRALELLERSPDGQSPQLEIHILLALSSIYRARYGWVSPLLKRTYERVVSLCERTNAKHHLVIAMFGLWSIDLMTLDFMAAEKLANQCLHMSQEMGDAQGMMQANIALCNTLFWLGRQQQAEEAAATALKLYRPEHLGDSIELLGLDPRALAGCFGALSASLLGLRAKAEQYRTDMLTAARELEHEFSLAIALQGSAWLEYHHRDPARTLQQAQELSTLAQKRGFPFYRGVSALFIGWARHKLYNDPEAGTVVQDGYHRWLASSGDRIAYSLYACIMGEILRDGGQWERARALLEQSIRLAHSHSENCYIAELYRLLADCSEGAPRSRYREKAMEYATSTPLFSQRIAEPEIAEAT